MRFKFSRLIGLFVLALVLAFVVTGCGATAHQYAIVADQGFAITVAALDDAERAYCATPTASQATCARLDPLVIQAIHDVKAVTEAIKDSPGAFPKNLPDLLATLAQLQAVIADAAPIDGTLASRLAMANTKATALLTQLMGGTQ